MNQLASSDIAWVLYACLGLYAAVILFFVIRGAVKTRTMADYAVGSVRFSPAAVGLSLAASMTSAATFIINPGFVAYYGLSAFLSMAVFLPLGALISLVLLSKQFRKYGQTVQAKTIPQWLGNRFNSNSFRLYFGFLSLLHLTFIVLICVGLTQVLSTALQTDKFTTLVVLVVFTFGYMMFGGANSMVYTNMIQAMLKVIVAVILLFSGVEFFSDGFSGFLQRLTSIQPQLSQVFNETSPLYRDFFEVVLCQIIVGVAIVCQPHIITRSLLLKSEKEMNVFLLVAVVVLVLFFSVIFAGLYARISFPDLQFDGKPLPLDGVMSAFVISRFSSFMSILLVVGLLASGIATLESLIQSISTTITSDLIKPLKGSQGIAKDSDLLLNRVVIAVMALITIWISWQQLVNPDLSVGILAQNGVYASFTAAFVPVLFGIFLREIPAYIPFTASVSALVVHVAVYFGRLTPYMQAGTRNPGIASALGIITSVIIGYLLYFLYKRKLSAA